MTFSKEYNLFVYPIRVNKDVRLSPGHLPSSIKGVIRSRERLWLYSKLVSILFYTMSDDKIITKQVRKKGQPIRK